MSSHGVAPFNSDLQPEQTLYSSLIGRPVDATVTKL